MDHFPPIPQGWGHRRKSVQLLDMQRAGLLEGAAGVGGIVGLDGAGVSDRAEQQDDGGKTL